MKWSSFSSLTGWRSKCSSRSFAISRGQCPFTHKYHSPHPTPFLCSYLTSSSAVFPLIPSTPLRLWSPQDEDNGVTVPDLPARGSRSNLVPVPRTRRIGMDPCLLSFPFQHRRILTTVLIHQQEVTQCVEGLRTEVWTPGILRNRSSRHLNVAKVSLPPT